MAEENDTLKLTSVNYTSDNYLAAKKNEDGSYNVADKVVFNENITTPGGEVATKADLDGKQDQLTPDNAGDNITITGEGSTLKINAAGGGETKAKAWLCTKIGGYDLISDYSYLEQYVGTILESVNSIDSIVPGVDENSIYAHEIAKVVFKEEKSMTEVSQWLNFEAKVYNYGSNPGCSDLRAMAAYGFHAVCPWPDNVPWPESN